MSHTRVVSRRMAKILIVIRWYKNKGNGWRHDSTVVVTRAKQP